MQSLNGNPSNPSLGGFGTQLNPFLVNDDIDENVLNISDLDMIVKNDKENNKKRDVSKLRVSEQKDGVKPHHYHYEPFVTGDCRQKIFKDSFKKNPKIYTLLKSDQNIKASRDERKNLETKIDQLSQKICSEKKWVATFSNLMFDSLKKDLPFETVFPLRNIFNECSTTYDDLKTSYDEIRSIYSEVASIIDFQSLKTTDILKGLLKDEMDELVNKCNLVKEELQKVEANKLTKAKGSIACNAKVVVDIDDELKSLRELLDRYEKVFEKTESNIEISLINTKYFLDGSKQISEFIEKKEKKYNCHFKRFNMDLEKILNDYSIRLEDDKKAVSDFLTTYWNRKLNGTCHSIKTRILSENINDDEFRKKIIPRLMHDTNLQNEFKKVTNEIIIIREGEVIHDRSYLLKHFISKIVAQVLDRNLKNLLLEKFTKSLANKETIDFFSLERERLMESKNWTSILTKEYKNHSLARFDHLFNYYTAFVNVIYNLGELGETKHPGFKKQLMEIVAHLVEHSSIELDNFPTDAPVPTQKLAKMKYKKAELQKKITVNPDFHRNERFIGSEKNHRTEVEQTSIKKILSLLMGIEKDDENGEFKDMITVDRSHTMPFPILFGWLADKMQNLIDPSYAFPKADKENPEKYFFNKDIFKEKRSRNISHRELEVLFKKEFNSFLDLPKQELLFKSLEMTRTFFMRLFSETELLPSFMNQFADSASEWRDKADSTSNYRTNLSNCMKDLILKGEKIEQAQVVKVLEPYMQKTLLNVENKLKNEMFDQEKIEHETNKQICSLFKQITFNLVKESLEMARKRVDLDTTIHKQFLIKEIFNKINDSKIACHKAVTKEVLCKLIRV